MSDRGKPDIQSILNLAGGRLRGWAFWDGRGVGQEDIWQDIWQDNWQDNWQDGKTGLRRIFEYREWKKKWKTRRQNLGTLSSV